jgi:DNA-binding NarL/FixJ family response regulator
MTRTDTGNAFHSTRCTVLPDTRPQNDSAIEVMIVEDDPAFFNRFCRIVTLNPDFKLFAAVRNGASARDCLARGAPDVLLVDLGLPDMNGIHVIREAAQRYPDIDIMVISVFGDEEHVLASIEAGATGYLLKDSVPEEFSDVIKQMRAGGSPISPVIARQLLKKLRPGHDATLAPMHDPPALSMRETEVLCLLAKGFSFGEIARMLEISPHTVTTYVKKIYRKLAVHSRGEAVYEASKMGLLR